MNLVHLVALVLEIKDEPGSILQKLRAVLVSGAILMAVPVMLVMAILAISLGDESGIGWVSLLCKICAVLMIVGIALLFAPKV